MDNIDRLPFGTPVRLAAQVEPRYLTWATTRIVYAPPQDSGGFVRGRQEPIDPPVLVVNDSTVHDADDIGEPLPDADDVPRGRVHRRLRRFPTTHSTGIVIGWVWRAEGAYSGGGAYGWDGEPKPPYLEETGRRKLYQVALDPGDVGGRFQPAAIVLAHPDDVEARQEATP